jgi:SAM-dependent methyltransferase
MAWSWVRPADASVLDGRPLLDLGTGDAATIRGRSGLVVGLDRSVTALRTAGPGRFVAGRAEHLPFLDGSLAVVVAGDLFHHLDDGALGCVLAEVRRVLRPDGLLVAWWYERESRGGPDAPRFPRPFARLNEIARGIGFEANELALEFTLEPAPPTVGLIARTRQGITVPGA